MTSPEYEFERLLSEAREGRVSGNELLNAMPDQIAYVPVVVGPGSDEADTFATAEIDGAPFVPAYSSEEQLVSAAGEAPRIKIPVRQLAELLPQQIGIAVNWRAAAPGLPITPAGVARLRASSNDVAAGSEVRIGEPARRPEEFLSALAASLKSVGSIHSARFGLMQVGDSQPVFVIGIDESERTEASRARIADLIAETSGSFPLEFQVETCFIDPSVHDGIRHEIVALPQVYRAS